MLLSSPQMYIYGKNDVHNLFDYCKLIMTWPELWMYDQSKERQDAMAKQWQYCSIVTEELSHACVNIQDTNHLVKHLFDYTRYVCVAKSEYTPLHCASWCTISDVHSTRKTYRKNLV